MNDFLVSGSLILLGCMLYLYLSQILQERSEKKLTKYQLEMNKFIRNLSKIEENFDVEEQLGKYDTLRKLRKVNKQLEKINQKFNL